MITEYIYIYNLTLAGDSVLDSLFIGFSTYCRTYSYIILKQHITKSNASTLAWSLIEEHLDILYSKKTTQQKQHNNKS